MTIEAESSPEGSASGHRRIVAALLVLATLVTFLAIFSIWVNRQALNTDNWVNTSDKLLQNEEVKSQLSNYLADQLFASVDVQGELEKTFPPRLAPWPVQPPGSESARSPGSRKGLGNFPGRKPLERGEPRCPRNSVEDLERRGLGGLDQRRRSHPGPRVVGLRKRRPARGRRQTRLESPARRRPADDPQVRRALRGAGHQQAGPANFRSFSRCWRSSSTDSRSTSPAHAAGRRCARSASVSSLPVCSASCSEGSPGTR